MRVHQQIPLDLSVRPAHGREDFLIGPENREAVAWLDRWPDWPSPALMLCGPAACGKSHLAAVWQQKSGACFLRPDSLGSEGAEDLTKNNGHVIIDGLDPWIGDSAAETTLFHIFNIFREQKRFLLLTLRMNPAQGDFALPDLASRLKASPLARIFPPGEDLLGAVLIKLFHDRQLAVSQDVIGYIVPRMERSFAAARDIVEAADHMALSQKRAVSVPLMRQVMAGMV